jgi:FkbM family methyltransferase
VVGVRSYYWLAVASLPLVMLGALGPWVTRFGVRVDGSQDEIVLILGVVAACIVLYLRASDRRWLAAGPLVIGLTLAALTANDIRDPADIASGVGARSLSLQWGIYLAFAGSAMLVLASAFVFIGPRLGTRLLTPIRLTPIRPRSLILGAFSDETVVCDFARRLCERDKGGAELLTKLVGEIGPHVASELVDRVTPTGELDYASHRIELVLGSRKVLGRLSSVEKEPFTVDWLESIGSGDVLYDIGANVGPYSLIAAKATDNQARVFAFEPSPATFRDLFRNVILNDCAESITALPVALWSETRVLSFKFHLFRSGAAKHRVASDLDSGHPRVARVVGVRLDDLVERFGLPVPTHAKIDVDGGELEVLRGAARTLRRPEWRSILIELQLGGETKQNRAVKALLEAAGFLSSHRHSRYPVPNDRKDRYWTFTR